MPSIALGCCQRWERKLTEWPEKFIYVCNATRASIINVLPMVHGGLDRIEEIFIFCGAPSDNTGDGTLQSEAVDPAHRLRRIGVEWSKGRLPYEKIKVLFGDPNDIATWRAHMSTAGAHAERQGLPILFNIKGGTKEMAIGGVLGTSGRGLQVITVRGTPFCVEAVLSDRQAPFPNDRNLTLDEYLDAYDLTEHNPRERQTLEQLYTENEDRIDELASIILKKLDHTRQIASALDVITRPLFRSSAKGRPTFLPGPIDPRTASISKAAADSLARALSKMDGLLGCAAVHDTSGRLLKLQITREDSVKFLKGGWLEAYLYNRLRSQLSSRSDVGIVANLGIGHRRADGRCGPRVAEIDVGVLVKSQLHIVEAKTASFTAKGAKDGGERSLAQIDSVKKQLIGQVGKVLIVNPRDDLQSVGRLGGDIDLRARRGGEELFLGTDAVERLVDRVKEIVATA